MNREYYISKFLNGEKRYNESPLVNQVVHSLVDGADPIGIIDHLIIINENINRKLEELTKDKPLAIYVTKENFDALNEKI